MKLVIIIFVLNVLKQCNCSCDDSDKITLLFWTIEYFNPIYRDDGLLYNNADLEVFLQYLRLRTRLKNVLVSKFPELQCDIEEICSTIVSEINSNNNENLFCPFCELYFKIEHNKEYVFTIDYLELWLFSQRNLSIHSNNLINKNLFLNTR